MLKFTKLTMNVKLEFGVILDCLLDFCYKPIKPTQLGEMRTTRGWSDLDGNHQPHKG